MPNKIILEPKNSDLKNSKKVGDTQITYTLILLMFHQKYIIHTLIPFMFHQNHISSGAISIKLTADRQATGDTSSGGQSGHHVHSRAYPYP